MKLQRTILSALLLATCLVVPAMADDPPPATDMTICEIQQLGGSDPGPRVHTTGICWLWTGRFGYVNTFIADPTCGSTWNGVQVYVYDEDLVAHEGDCVEVWGRIQEYYDKTEIVVHSPDNEDTPEPNRPIVTENCWLPMPVPAVLSTAGVADEQYEGMWVEIHDAVVMSHPSEGTYWNWEVDDGSGYCVILLGNWGVEIPPIGSTIPCISGLDDFDFGQFKIKPRSAEEFPCGMTTPTPTPTEPAGTPTPTPTSSGCNATASLILNKIQPTCYAEGDQYLLQFDLDNSSCGAQDVDWFLAMEVQGEYYLHPNWDMSVIPRTISLPASDHYTETVLDFTWPAGAAPFMGANWYVVITNPGTFDVMSLDQKTFCWE